MATLKDYLRDLSVKAEQATRNALGIRPYIENDTASIQMKGDRVAYEPSIYSYTAGSGESEPRRLGGYREKEMIAGAEVPIRASVIANPSLSKYAEQQPQADSEPTIAGVSALSNTGSVPSVPQPQGQRWGMSISDFLAGGTNDRLPNAPKPLAGRGETISIDEWNQMSERTLGAPGTGITTLRPGVDVPSLAEQRRETGEIAPWQARSLARANGATGSAVNAVADQILAKNRKQSDQEQLTAKEQIDVMRGIQALDIGELQKQKLISEIGGMEEKKKESFNKDVMALQDAFNDTSRVAEAAGDAARSANFFTAGLFSPLKYIGGTGAADLAATLKVVEADSAFDALRAMKASSPTGGALGQISNKEIDLLSASRAAVFQNQSPKQLRSNLAKYIKLRNDVLSKAKSGFIREYGQSAFDAMFVGDSSKQGNGGAQSSAADYSGSGFSIAD